MKQRSQVATKEEKQELSSNALTLMGVVSIVLGIFLKEHSYLAFIGIITLPMAFVRSYRERKERKNSEFKFGVVDSLVVIGVTVIMTFAILVLLGI